MKNDEPSAVDVLIVGDGYAGMNTARILKENGINCSIYSYGMGASQFWAGTFDFLKFYGENLSDALDEFKDILPSHPYRFIKYEEAVRSFENFSKSLPDIEFFKEDGFYVNKQVLTSIGNLKPCVGVWKTIFHDFEKLTASSLCVLVDFIEFNNSAMDLAALGLKENAGGKYLVLKLSIVELIKIWESKSGSDLNSEHLGKKLNENQIAQYFDTHFDQMEEFISYLNSEFRQQQTKWSDAPVDFYLFPPVLGLLHYNDILKKLSELLNAECAEIVAQSPSLFAKRLINIFSQHLTKLDIQLTKGYALTAIEKDGDKWKSSFENRKGELQTVKSQYIVFSTGSLFHTGIFETESLFKSNFDSISIPIPNNVNESFELTSTPLKHNNEDHSISTNLFVCGSSSYLFLGGITDEEEIKYCTGLGLAISTSHKVATSIIKRIKFIDNPKELTL